jgi:hypothetical protein
VVEEQKEATMRRKLCGWWVILVLVPVTNTAFGQTQKGTETQRERSSGVRVTETSDDTWTAVFDDDPLSGEGFGANAPILRVRPVSAYGFLIRPRTHFVPELLKSVERI